MPLTALVVDDDPVSRLVLCHMLRARGWNTLEAADTHAAISVLSHEQIDLVISDFNLPSGTGVDILNALGDIVGMPAFILITGIIEYSILPTAIISRLAAQLTKPVSSETLRNVLESTFPAISS
jgi:CheY-like chemotaxis protein